MKIKLDPWGITPTRAHDTDAGLDIYSPITEVIQPFSSGIFHTGVHVQLPPGTVGIMASKSGLNVKHGITSTGVIDEGYSGELVVKLYNHTDKGYMVAFGDKITQLLVLPVRYEPIEIVDEIEAGERGDSGFGSTGK